MTNPRGYHGMGPLTAEAITLGARHIIRLTSDTGTWLGDYTSPDQIAARGYDLSDVTIKGEA